MTNEIYRHGIKGQRWGVRRYRNPDGTLTNAGKKRQVHDLNRIYKTLDKQGKQYLLTMTTKQWEVFYRKLLLIIKP